MEEVTQIIVPDAPHIDGLGFRGLQDRRDYAELAVIRAGSVLHDQVDVQSPREGLPTAADLERELPFAEMRDHPDFLIVTMDDRIIGYAHALWRWTEVTGERVYLHLGYLLPEWRGQGVGTAMLRWSQSRIRVIAATEGNAGPATFATNVSSTEREAASLMEEAGYTVVRQLSDMTLDLDQSIPPAPFSRNIECRPLANDHVRAIYDAWKDAFAHVWTSTPPSDEDFMEFVNDNVTVASFDPTLCEIGWAGDEVVGLVLCRVDRGVGIIAEVAVRPHWQRQGIARGLMLRTLNTLQERKVPQARLFTDAEDHQGARSLYTWLGFSESKRHFFYRKPL